MDNGQERQSAGEGAQQKPAYGFYLVLAAIVVVAIVYSVTIFSLEQQNRTPEVVFGAMAASFTVIGTLVGTYFGIKAGLDGQDKVKETLSRAGDSSRERSQVGTEKNGDRKSGRQQAGEQQRTTSELQELKGGREDGNGWEGGGV